MSYIFKTLFCSPNALFCSLLHTGRTIITDQQKQSLKHFFEKGMRSVGSPLVQAAAEITALPPSIIEVSSLEELGVETIVLSFDHQKATMEVSEVSSKGASEFLASTDTVNNFALHFKASSSAIRTTKEPVSVLVKRVQELFNQKYKDVGGVGKIPYQSLRNHNVTIHAAGLPKGLTLKKPSFYGRKQLEDIIKAEDQISFHIGGENGAQSQTVEEILDAMCGNGRFLVLL
ncbi:uncharacterized protein LOC114844693 isoform X2 [Betta splendens]|uniref:Uncharacterized protein LOC114844693 isoform X2 n=1 Tax=Betta splendens TaxID=158456 RepID=A0A9W2XDV9_BETSP|nr:uncharacterized protein LOC114844693 isoform X2 [Betta splendens]